MDQKEKTGNTQGLRGSPLAKNAQTGPRTFKFQNNLSEMDTAGEGEGGMNSKRSTETNTLPHVKQTAVESCYVTPGAQPGVL